MNERMNLESISIDLKSQFIQSNAELFAQWVGDLLGYDPSLESAVDGVLEDHRNEVEEWLNS